MKLSWSQIIFYYLFDILLLLLFLFAESFLGIYVVGAFALLLLFYSRKLEFHRVDNYKNELKLFVLFLIGLVVSGFFSHNLPLTLNALIFYFFGFAIFSFFLFVPRDLFHLNFLLWNLILVVLGIGVISWVFAVLPGLADQLPGMNLIYATYGHNHYGALVILFLPLVWYYLLKNQTDRKKFLFFFAALVFLVVNLILSFGRVLIFLGFLELIILFSLTAKTMPWVGNKIKLFFIFLVMAMGAAFLLKNSFSLARLWYKDVACPLPSYQEKVCKNVSADLRITYWQSAVMAFKDHPLLGYGPGTYKLIAEKYKTRPDAGTSFAHNSFLQILAEGGLFAGLPFLFLVFYLFFKSFKQFSTNYKIEIVKNKVTNWRLFVFIGLVATLLNGLFDFDWSFLGVFSVSLVLMVILIRQEKSHLLKNAKMTMFPIIYKSVLVFLVGMTVLSLIVEAMISTKRINLAAEFFPYFQTHMQLFLESDQLSVEHQKKISEIYQNVSYLYLDDQQKDKKEANWLVLEPLAPWYFYEASSVKSVVVSDPNIEANQLKRTSNQYLIAKKHGFPGLIPADLNLSKQAIQVADRYLGAGLYQEAVEMYQVGLVFDEWVFNNTYPRFLYDLKTFEQRKEFWSKMNVDQKVFGKHVSVVGGIYFSLLRSSIDQRDLPEVGTWLDKLLSIAPWSIEEVKKIISPRLQILADQLIKDGQNEQAVLALSLATKDQSYFSNLQLGNYYLMMGEIERAKLEFQSCNQRWMVWYGVDHDDCLKMFLSNNLGKNYSPYHLTGQSILESK